MNTRQMLSALTRNGLQHSSGDYVSKDHDELDFIAGLKRKYNLKQIYRFDIGKNTDGFSHRILEKLSTAELPEALAANYIDYPDNQYLQLRMRLAEKFKLPPDMFLPGAGLESIIDHIARACLEPEDSYLIPVPNFSVFEDMSSRISSHVIRIPLDRESYRWTKNTTKAIIKSMVKHRPKLVWISNPVNPTGQHIGMSELEQIILCGRKTESFIVIDEAYGEYTDSTTNRKSAARFVKDSSHLMVLRTFSKLYGLPSARVGYMICSCPNLREAVRFYRPMFPFSWMSLYMAQLAVEDDRYLEESRLKLKRRKENLLTRMDSLHSFELLPSDVNTVMIRHKEISASDLSDALARSGIMTANLNRVSGIEGEQFLRMTVRNKADNLHFIKACTKLN